MVYDHRPPRLKNPTGLSPYILNTYVPPKYRHRGIATMLLQMLINHARAAGSKTITLHFWPGKSALYAKVGFVPTEAEMKLEL
jgi:GNAT superfamily N-acetyltransferase